MAGRVTLGKKLAAGNRKAGLDLLIEELGKDLEVARMDGRPTSSLFAQLRLAMKDRAELDVGARPVPGAKDPDPKGTKLDGVDEVAERRNKRRAVTGNRAGTDPTDQTRRGR